MDMEVSTNEQYSAGIPEQHIVDHLTNGTVKVNSQQLSSTAPLAEVSSLNNNNNNTEDDESSGKLKRSSSAPMINQLLPHARVSAPPTPTPPRLEAVADSLQPRARRFSASFQSFSPASPMSPGSSSSRSCSRMRVCQLRQEEGMDVVNREVAHEREVQSSLQMARSLSQSYEDLAIDDDTRKKDAPRPSRPDYSDPLHLNVGLGTAASSPCPPCGSASPTRPGRQCFSPSLQQCVRNSPFTPSPSKRPSSFMATRRSLSPITSPSNLSSATAAFRPASTKRKCDEETGGEFIAPNKRMSMGGYSSPSEGCGLLIPQTQSSDGVSPSSIGASASNFHSSFSSFKHFTNSSSGSAFHDPNRRSLSPYAYTPQDTSHLLHPKLNPFSVSHSSSSSSSSNNVNSFLSQHSHNSGSGSALPSRDQQHTLHASSSSSHPNSSSPFQAQHCPPVAGFSSSSAAPQPPSTRSSTDSTETSTIDTGGRTVFPLPATQHPHLFRPVSPASSSCTSSTTTSSTSSTSSTIVHSTPSNSSGVVAMVTDEVPALVEAMQVQTKVEDSSSGSTGSTCDTSMDSNKLFQSMELTEDSINGSQTRLQM